MNGLPRRPAPARRSRRLRKKLHLDEFREDGFAVRLAFVPADDPLEHLRFWDAFIAEAIEANGLIYGGGAEGFAMPERGSATDAHREAVRAWLATRTELSATTVGPLADAWYDEDEAPKLPS